MERIRIDGFLQKALRDFAGKDKTFSYRIEDENGDWLDGFGKNEMRNVYLAFNFKDNKLNNDFKKKFDMDKDNKKFFKLKFGEGIIINVKTNKSKKASFKLKEHGN